MNDLGEYDMLSSKIIGMNSIIMFAKQLGKGKPNRRTMEKADRSYRQKSKARPKREEENENIVVEDDTAENIKKKNTKMSDEAKPKKNEIVYSSNSAKNLKSDSDIEE